MKIVERYLARQIFASTALVFAALLALFTLLDLIHELGDVGASHYRVLPALVFVLLSLPGHIYELFPIASLIGTIFALTQIAANSEFTVLRVSSVSVFMMAKFLARIGLVFVLLTFFFGEVVAPYSDEAAQRLRLSTTRSVVAQEFRSGLWVKDEASFINVREILPDSTLIGIRIFKFDENHALQSISHAEKGSYAGDHLWNLSDVVETNFSQTAVSVGESTSLQWKSVITPDLLSVLLVFPEHMSAITLYSYIQHLLDNKQHALRYQIALWTKLVYPFAVLVMMLLALPFAYYQKRAGGISGRIVFGIMLGLGFYLSNQLSSRLGLINGWPPFVGAAMPTLLFLGAALGVLNYLERK